MSVPRSRCGVHGPTIYVCDWLCRIHAGPCFHPMTKDESTDSPSSANTTWRRRSIQLPSSVTICPTARASGSINRESLRMCFANRRPRSPAPGSVDFSVSGQPEQNEQTEREQPGDGRFRRILDLDQKGGRSGGGRLGASAVGVGRKEIEVDG